jgi:hypothetical protein
MTSNGEITDKQDITELKIETIDSKNHVKGSTLFKQLHRKLIKKVGPSTYDIDIVKNDVIVTGKAERENWSGRFDFFLSCLGYSIGLGNVWRFPYFCYKNGGGVFLVPFFLFMFLVGIPLFFLELNLGQYTSQGLLSCWQMAPIFRGIGVSMNIASFYLAVYYNMIIAYSIYYFVISFRKNLLWSKCDASWASLQCVDDFENKNYFSIDCDQPNQVKFLNGQCFNSSDVYNSTHLINNANLTNAIGWWNTTRRIAVYGKPIIPSDDFFK